MRFLEAMHWLEEEHSFPHDKSHFHNLRFAEIARRSDLFSKMPPLVVVTGSCGKASTARFLAFMLRAAGLKVGLGTKPPLQESPQGNLERYQYLDSQGEHWLDPELFARIVSPLPALAAELEPALGPIAPYDLRAWVLLRAFQEWQVDIGIVEANIGLRHDPAGAIPGAALTVITPIATDHAQMLVAPPEWQYLGPAAGPLWHKLSAVPSERVVVSRQPSIDFQGLDALLDRPGPRWGRDFDVAEVASGLWGGRGVLRSVYSDLTLELSCLGDFQVENAATAAMAFFELGQSDRQAVLAGARHCQIPGRLQVLGRQPLELLCVASSQTKVKAMLDALEPLFDRTDSRLVMVVTLLDRIHGVAEVIDFLASYPRLATLVVTQGQYNDDSQDMDPTRVAALASQANPSLEVIAESDMARAIALGKNLLDPDGLLLLLGNGLAAFASQSSLSGF